MMTKDLFVKNQELRDFWAAFAKKPEFDTVLTYAKAVFIESNKCNTDMLAGALGFCEVLTSLGDEPAGDVSTVRTGFHHLPDKV